MKNRFAAATVGRSRSSWLSLLIVFAIVSAARADEPNAPIPDPLTLAWCLERARVANPDLERAEAIAAAARSRVGFAGTFEDPRFSYEASNLPIGDFNFNSTPMSGHQLGLRQKLPFPGLLSSKEGAARRDAEASSLMWKDQVFRTQGAVESVWAELGFVQGALDITRQNIDLLRQLAETAESRYRVGTGHQQDVIRAQVELTALLQEELQRTEAIARVQSQLIELLDLPDTTRLPRTAELTIPIETPALEPLLRSLDDESARLAAGRKHVEAAEAQVRTAEIEGLPDVDLGLGYRIRENVRGDPVEGDDFFTAGVTIRLPVDRSKWRARVAEQRAQVRHAEADLRGVRAQLAAQMRRAHAELHRAAAEEALLETGLIPQARQSLDSSRSAYEVGQIGFLGVLDSQVRLLGAELRLARARADKRRALAALETAAGRKLR
jgi:outer membrane protein TolC